MPTYRARVLSPRSPEAVDYWEDGVVVVEGELIAEVGPYDGLPVDEDLRPGLLTPGFVDAHVHYPQSRIVGAASGPLLEWLERSVFPQEQRFADDGYAREVADSFVEGLARAGTTLAMVYGSVHASATQILLETLEARGLRAIAGPVLMDVDSPEALIRPPELALPELEALAERWRGHPRLQVAVIPRFALSCSVEMMEAAAELARERDLWVSTHISENADEIALTCARFQAQDYLEVYERHGLIHARTVLAHCIHFSPSEWERMAAAQAVVAHCPDSNAFLGSGSMPVGEVLGRDIPLAIGSDVAAGRSLSIPHGLAHAYDNGLRTGTRLDPRRLLWWGTAGGAQALGYGPTGAGTGGLGAVGRLAPGYAADMALHPVPSYVEGEDGVLGALLFDADRPRPTRTWVGGREVYSAGAGATDGDAG